MRPSGLAIGCLVVLLGLAAGARGADRIDSPGPQPEGLGSDGTYLYVTDFTTNRVYRFDTDSGDLVSSYPTPGTGPEGLTWDGSHLWTGSWYSRQIYRMAVGDSALTVVQQFAAPLGARPVGLAWDGEALWLTTWTPYYLHRLDPATGAATFSRDLDAEPLYPAVSPRPEDLAWDGSQLWITDWFTGEIHRFHPDTLVVNRTLESPGPSSVGLAFHQGYLWNGDTTLDALFRLDITDGSVAVRRVTWGGLKRLISAP